MWIKWKESRYRGRDSSGWDRIRDLRLTYCKHTAVHKSKVSQCLRMLFMNLFAPPWLVSPDPWSPCPPFYTSVKVIWFPVSWCPSADSEMFAVYSRYMKRASLRHLRVAPVAQKTHNAIFTLWDKSSMLWAPEREAGGKRCIQEQQCCSASLRVHQTIEPQPPPRPPQTDFTS